MSRSQTKVYRRVQVPKRNGKGMRTKLMLVQKKVATNTLKGANVPELTNQQLKAMKLQNSKQVALANIANAGQLGTQMISQAGATARSAINSKAASGMTSTNNSAGVNQTINGGATPGKTGRDEESGDDNPFIN